MKMTPPPSPAKGKNKGASLPLAPSLTNSYSPGDTQIPSAKESRLSDLCRGRIRPSQ